MINLILILGALTAPTSVPVAQTWDRDDQFAIPLQSSASGGHWGLIDRKADHATVAMNSVGDVLIAYHSSRPDFNANYDSLKQVEIAFLEYDSTSDSWSLESQNQKVVGGVDPSPLSGTYQQTDVKCERPDVIAVGEMFFVVWTRIYERQHGSGNPSDQINEPAVLECAWVKKDSNGDIQVYTGNAAAGAGFELDRDSTTSRFFVRECAGCPDAVVLHPGDANTLPTVGIVYPHQTNFGDYGSPADNQRLFELRFQACSIDPANGNAISSVAYPALVASNGSTTGIVYDGYNNAAGIVLPDLAPGSDNWRFGLAYEEQLKPGSVTNGRIILQTWEATPNGASIAQLESHAFGNSSTTAYRRRPILSSYPAAFPGQDVFAIAFNKVSTTGVGEVIYQEWLMTEGTSAIYWSTD